MSLFSQFTFCLDLSNESLKFKKEIQEIIKKNGGKIGLSINQQTTHVITTEKEILHSSLKIRAAYKYNCHVVFPSFIFHSQQKNKKEEEWKHTINSLQVQSQRGYLPSLDMYLQEVFGQALQNIFAIYFGTQYFRWSISEACKTISSLCVSIQREKVQHLPLPQQIEYTYQTLQNSSSETPSYKVKPTHFLSKRSFRTLNSLSKEADVKNLSLSDRIAIKKKEREEIIQKKMEEKRKQEEVKRLITQRREEEKKQRQAERILRARRELLKKKRARKRREKALFDPVSTFNQQLIKMEKQKLREEEEYRRKKLQQKTKQKQEKKRRKRERKKMLRAFRSIEKQKKLEEKRKKKEEFLLKVEKQKKEVAELKETRRREYAERMERKKQKELKKSEEKPREDSRKLFVGGVLFTDLARYKKQLKFDEKTENDIKQTRIKKYFEIFERFGTIIEKKDFILQKKHFFVTYETRESALQALEALSSFEQRQKITKEIRDQFKAEKGKDGAVYAPSPHFYVRPVNSVTGKKKKVREGKKES